MRTKWMLAAIVAGACGAIAAPAGLASAEESAQQVISRLQSEGYTVNIDRVGTAPLNECVVTNVRNPQQFTQWVPYTGPGGRGDGDRALVLVVTSQSISVTLDCSR
jgi:hypothetical protein